MFKHTLKISFRNLWKYKTQTVISIIGLAVGFTCFSLATLWIRYESTYDSFHKNAKHLYMVIVPDSFREISFSIPSPFPAYLKETFPEVKEAVNISGGRKLTYELDGKEIELHNVDADSAFLKMFDVKILEGSLDFSDYTKEEIAVTKKTALKLFGQESPIGKALTLYGSEHVITAIVSDYSEHSNFACDVLGVAWINPGGWNTRGNSCMVELHPNVNAEAFKKKLYEHKISQSSGSEGARNTEWTNTELISLTDLRTKDPTKAREIKFQHIKLFALMGILVVLCSLFNYLTLFVSRFKIRGKELALRVVCGASLLSLFSLLLAEFLITLLVAVLLGLMIINLVSPVFQNLSEIQMNVGNVYAELILYIFVIILLTILLFAITLAVFRKYALNVSIRHSNNQMFRKISIVSQLIVSIGFVFCTVVMIKQIRYLHNSTDIGFEYKNRGCLYIHYDTDAEVIGDKMKQIPDITEVVAGYQPLMPIRSQMGFNESEWDGKTDIDKSIFICGVYLSKEFIDFYGLQLIVGEMITDGESPHNALINESAMKAFGWHIDEAVGKKVGGKTVKGVLKNIYNGLPTVEAAPAVYSYVDYRDKTVLFKYTNRKIADAKIIELLKKEFPDISKHNFDIFDAEEAYEKFFKSENALITILNVMSAVCVLISIFGFFSLVSLSCEEKRKEIAIRKVNGADIHDIIAIFFKEYSLLLAIGAAIAFPIGYYIAKGWIEQYINQTSIDAWIYAAILLAFAFIIVICVGYRVYKTSRENPADVVKSE